MGVEPIQGLVRLSLTPRVAAIVTHERTPLAPESVNARRIEYVTIVC